LVLASAAWRWHLTGGLSIVVAAVVFLSYFILRPPYEAHAFYIVYFSMAMVFLGGGILHLAAWLEERRG
jgi:hypothetical protein